MRISTHFGLKEESDSFLAHLAGLTHIPLAEHFVRLEHQGPRVLLFRSSKSTLLPEQLAKLIALPGKRSASAMTGGVVVEMKDPAAAAMVRLTDRGLTRYERTRFDPGRQLELTRCLPGSGPRKIVVRNVTQDEEWRLLLAREVDLVPVISPSHQRYLVDVPTVRIVPVRTPTPVALAFRVRAPAPTAQVDLRRAISSRIVRQALAESIDANLAEPVKMQEDRDEARRSLERLGGHVGARHLRLYFDEAVADLQRVALVIEQQLAPLGIVVDIQALRSDALLEALKKGDFDMLLHRVGFEKRFWPWLPRATGYESPEFEAAVGRGDDAAARAILEQDLPLTPLYLFHEGVVLDNYFCGATPITVTDLSWLDAVHPCKPGENQ
ncbi:MAG TPA: ABC transporter substrate-binding protein [Polyangia bacterium]|nr:ABC transporter substrate-binding protein [Polyangia bacterium]